MAQNFSKFQSVALIAAGLAIFLLGAAYFAAILIIGEGFHLILAVGALLALVMGADIVWDVLKDARRRRQLKT